LGEITKLVGAIRGVLSDLVVSPGQPDALRERCEAALQKANLKPDDIKKTFLISFSKAAEAA
jgi:hypothetical protein